MSTPHNRANIGDIANIVIMPGDPLRAKYIVENFFDSYELVNDVRGIYTYTGIYKGKRISVMASGMGIPSMGIYSYELFHFYNVDYIIRIGTCGAFVPDLKLLDIILVNQTYTESNYALSFDNKDIHTAYADINLNNLIKETASKNNVKYYEGTTLCNECFDPYVPNINAIFSRIPEEINICGCEMEAFSLFYNAQREGKHASCLLNVVDSLTDSKSLSSEERQNGLNTMIKLALDSALNI